MALQINSTVNKNYYRITRWNTLVFDIMKIIVIIQMSNSINESIVTTG